MGSDLLWWAYLHTNGHIQVKRYFPDTGKLDLDDADASPFVQRRTDPFDASTREEAEKLAIGYLGVTV